MFYNRPNFRKFIIFKDTYAINYAVVGPKPRREKERVVG